MSTRNICIASLLAFLIGGSATTTLLTLQDIFPVQTPVYQPDEKIQINEELRRQHAAFRTEPAVAVTSLFQETLGTRKADASYEILTNSTTTHILITDSCGPHFDGECLNVRSEPSTTSEKVAKLRNNTVLAVEQEIEVGSTTWYQVSLDEKLHYPERVTTEWYVSSGFSKPLNLETDISNTKTGSKRIQVDISEQTLTAYEGFEKIMEVRVSTGITGTPTPIGNYTVLRKTPSRYMQGPLKNGVRENSGKEISTKHPDYYDLPGVPWNLYITDDGIVIHGAFWHVNFGKTHSHGCVNMPPENAEALYDWAPVGTPVEVVL